MGVGYAAEKENWIEPTQDGEKEKAEGKRYRKLDEITNPVHAGESLNDQKRGKRPIDDDEYPAGF
jgi:hypothetical protein